MNHENLSKCVMCALIQHASTICNLPHAPHAGRHTTQGKVDISLSDSLKSQLIN